MSSDPAYGAFAITPNDSTVFTAETRGLYVGGAGDVTVDTVSLHDSNVTFSAVPAGTILPVRCRRVMATGTTATNIIGLY